MQATTTHTNTLKTALLCLAVGLVVALGAYAVWREFIRDKMISCALELGDIHFDVPDIGQRLYCPDKSSH